MALTINQLQGWHIDDELPMNFSSLYRWITLLYEEQIPEKFYVQPVDIVSEELVTYTPIPTGDPIPKNSQERVSPGDYCIYNKGVYISEYLISILTFHKCRWIAYR